MVKQSDSIVLSFNDVNFIHGKLHADLEFSKDERVLLSGDNGVGKTSLLNYLKLNQKLIEIDSFFISQNDIPRHEVLSTIHLLNILKNSIRERFNEKQFRDFVQSLGIESLLNRSVKSLSGGERQLMKLALGFAIKADFYFIDEPFNNLSFSNREKVRSYLKNNLNGFFIIDHFSKEWEDDFNREYHLTHNESQLELSEVCHV